MAKNNYDVVTIGAAMRDVFVQSAAFENIPSKGAPDGFEACVPLGAKIAVDHLDFLSGGGATNAATTFARFRLRTACISRLGQDPDGIALRQELTKEHINTSLLQTDPKRHTGYSIILLAGSGHRAILTARGASAHLEAKKIPWSTISTRWIYLTSVGGDMALVRHIFQAARKMRARIAWNPGNAELEHGRARLMPYVEQTDLLLVNTEEAAALTEQAPRHPHASLAILGSLTRFATIITDGERGAYAYVRGTNWYVAPKAVKVRNTTGAGDAFGSACVAALIKDRPLNEALQIGTLNAMSVISHMGAKTGILKQMPGKAAAARIKLREE
jgi:sugar/nucleoside kinase (ribokinase family)